MTPELLAPNRRWPFARLGLFTLAEAGLLGYAATTARDVLVAVGAGQSPLASLALTFSAAAGGLLAGWSRQVCAEDLGMRYANELRLMLAAHAASGGGKRRLGALAVRLTGDLNPMRDWASLGISDAAAGAASLCAGLIALSAAAGPIGFGAGAGICVLAGVYFWFLRKPLMAALDALRRSRGRVAAAAGDIVLSAGAIARYDAFARESARLERRAARLLDASLRRRRLAAALEAPAALATSAIIAAMLALSTLRGPSFSIDGWALALFGAGIFGMGLRQIARAVDSQAAFTIARRRMDQLWRQIDIPKPASDAADQRSADGKARAQNDGALFSVSFCGTTPVDVGHGEVILVYASDPTHSLAAIEDAAGASPHASLQGRVLAAFAQKDLARRVGLAAPSAPLLRASVRRNLTLRRTSTTDEELDAALRLVGLVASRWPPQRRIDPALREPGEHVQALLRLARAITHNAKVILVAEPVLLHAPDAPELYLQIARATGAAVIAASSAQPREGVRQITLDCASAAA